MSKGYCWMVRVGHSKPRVLGTRRVEAPNEPDRTAFAPGEVREQVVVFDYFRRMRSGIQWRDFLGDRGDTWEAWRVR